MLVLHVESGGEVRRFAFERTFTLGTIPGLQVSLPPEQDGYSFVIFVLPDQATVGAGNRNVRVMLDGRDIELDHRRLPLRAGSVLVASGATITIEQVPHGRSVFDADAAREFDRDMEAEIAAEPPPRQQIDSFSLSMDAVARVRAADPATLVLRPPRNLGDLESALGLAFPVDLYVQAAVFATRGQATDHAVSSVSAMLVTGSLTLASGFIEDTRHDYLESYRVEWSHGRARCEAALASKLGAPCEVSDGRAPYRAYANFLVDTRDGDAFTLAWHDTLPDWAVPCDAVLRAGWLSELAATLAACTQREQLVVRLGDVPASAGIQTRDERDEVWIEIAPTISAPELVLALGWSDIAWKRADGCDDVPYILVGARGESPKEPRIGRWRVSAQLDGHFPNGPELPGERFLRAIVPADRIRHLRISR